MSRRIAHITVGGVPRAVDLFAPAKVTIATAAGAPIADRENYVNATITIGGAAPRTTQIRGRGNSTWDAPKKPYRLKLATAASLVPGVPADRDWVLLAGYYDPSLVRTLIATDIGLRCPGLAWTPRFRPVEVTLNGTYLGVYLLGEHVKIGANRVNVTGMKATDLAGLALTGGYSMEIDKRGVGAGDPGFTTSHSMAVAYDDPDGAIAAQATYAQNFITDFENALYASTWLNPATGYARFIDQAAFIDWYLVNELGKNLDANGYSSIKLHKPRDTADAPGRLRLGPLWDFDNSFGNRFGSDVDPTGPWVLTSSDNGDHPGFTWLARMLADPAFLAAVRARWATLRASLTGPRPIGPVVTKAINTLGAAGRRDRAAWSYTGDTATEITNWITARTAWMDTQYG